MADKQLKDFTPYDSSIADTDVIVKQSSIGVTKGFLFSTLKSVLKTYFDTVYSAIAGSTSQVFSVSSLEVGNTDTTLSRSSAGVIAVEGVVIPTISSTNTITNKRIQKRVVTITQSATPSINTDNGDIFQITGLTQAITSMTSSLTGTPVAGEMIMIQITDNGTARSITWGASFASTTVALPTTTVISTMLRILFQRNNANTVWDCIAVA